LHTPYRSTTTFFPTYAPSAGPRVHAKASPLYSATRAQVIGTYTFDAFCEAVVGPAFTLARMPQRPRLAGILR
jgi:hypothetical protein